MSPKEVSENLGIRQFLSLCSTIDMVKGTGTRFSVIKIKKGNAEPVIEIIVCFEKGDVQGFQIAA